MRYKLATLLVIGLIVRMLCVGYYIENFDTHRGEGNGQWTHKIADGDAFKYFREGVLIKESVDSGTPFFSVPVVKYYLYPRLIAAYGIFTGNLGYGERGVALGQVGGFLYLQAVFSIACAVLFLWAISLVVCRAALVPIALFLLFEPSMIQLPCELMTESIFMGLIMICVSLWVFGWEASRRWISLPCFAALGAMLVAVFLQRPAGLLLPIVFVVANMFWLRSRSARKVVCATLVFLSVFIAGMSVYGEFNSRTSGHFYVMPLNARSDLLEETAAPVWAERYNNPDAFDMFMARCRVEAIANGVIPKDGPLNVEQKAALGDIHTKFAIAIFLKHPILTLKRITIKMMKCTMIIPLKTHNRAFLGSQSGIGNYYAKEEMRYTNRVWTALILVPFFVGVVLQWVYGGAHAFNVLLVGLVAYFPITCGWIGDPRYTLSNLCVYAVYWGLTVTFFRRLLSDA